MSGLGRVALAAVIAVTAGTAAARAEESEDGNRRLFVKHCAECHGRDGKGGGAAASELAQPPPDLTRLARDNGGEFPLARVMRAIDGRDRPHGSSDMPVWGEEFAYDYTDPYRDRWGIRIKVRRLAEFIESIQEPGN